MKKLILLFSLFIAFAVNAQSPICDNKYKFSINFKYLTEVEDLTGLKVTLSNNQKELQKIENKKEFIFLLCDGEEYLVTIEHKGYITTEYIFNTQNIPSSVLEGFFHEVHLGFTLDKQPTNAIVRYNQPFAVYSYMRELDGFGFTTNLSKTVKQKVVGKEALKEK